MGTDPIDPREAAHARRLAVINRELVSLYGENALLLKAEREAFAQGWEASGEGTVSGREAVARHNSSGYKIERITVEGDIQALTQEQDHIRFVLKYQLWRAEDVPQ